MDDDLFKGQLARLDEACREETDDMKKIVSEIIPTYVPGGQGTGCPVGVERSNA